MREKLIDLMMQAQMGWTKGEFADHLIANGVTILDKAEMPRVVKREFMHDSNLGWFIMFQLRWMGKDWFFSQQIPNEPREYIDALIKETLKGADSDN